MADTLYRAFAEVAARFAERPALMHKVEGTYHAVTYAQLSRAVDETAAGLAQRDVRPGSRVAIYSYNRPEWVVADLAAVKLGAEVVPVYHTLPADSVGYILRDAGVSHLFVENEELLAVVTGLLPGLPGLECVVTFSDRPAGPGTGPGIISLASLRADGAAALGRDPAAGAAHPARSGDLLTICYTSGTTGEPKGTMLTHANVMSNVAGAINLAGVNEQDVLVSFLPLCHMFERTCGYYTMLLAGACIAYAETVQTVAQDVRLVRPTVLIVVPRVLEKVYNTVTERVLAGSQLQRRLMVATLRSHTRCARLRQRGLRAPPSLALARWFTGLLVVRKLRRLGGGRIRLIFSGAAPLEKRLANVFRALGFNLLEGYGLTETSPVACAAVPGQERVGTVGKPFPGVEVRIGRDDEILIRGPNVMKGYLNKPEETARAIDKEGWLHTGDQGRFDDAGNLVVTGRIKELIVNSYGKNVPPVPVEQALVASPYIEQAMVIGDRRPFLSALVVPGRVTLEDWARAEGLAYSDYPTLLDLPPVVALFRSEIERAVANRAPHEQVKRFRLIPEPCTVENGLLTPTLKVRRGKVEAAYHEMIDSMYREC